jgi:hypothetical protein
MISAWRGDNWQHYLSHQPSPAEAAGFGWQASLYV